MNRRRLYTPIEPPPAPTNGNRTRGSYISQANLDINMVFILAALLCALIFALGLNSIVRFTHRCFRMFAPETQEQRETTLAASNGLKKRNLMKIPVAVYGSGVNISDTECPICLGEFVDGEKVRVLPNCNHGFHVRCIDTWLVSHSSCPNCRHSLLEIEPAPARLRHVAEFQPPGNESDQQSSIVVNIEEGRQ